MSIIRLKNVNFGQNALLFQGTRPSLFHIQSDINEKLHNLNKDRNMNRKQSQAFVLLSRNNLCKQTTNSLLHNKLNRTTAEHKEIRLPVGWI